MEQCGHGYVKARGMNLQATLEALRGKGVEIEEDGGKAREEATAGVARPRASAGSNGPSPALPVTSTPWIQERNGDEHSVRHS